VEYQGHMQTVKVTGPDFRIYYHGEAGTERLLAGLQKKIPTADNHKISRKGHISLAKSP